MLRLGRGFFLAEKLIALTDKVKKNGGNINRIIFVVATLHQETIG